MEDSRYSGQHSRYANQEEASYDSQFDSSYGYDSSGAESDLNMTPRGYPRGTVQYERRHDVSGRLMPPRDASGRFLPVYEPGKRARSYYKARQSFQPVEPFKRDRHGRLHDALGRWMSDIAAPGEGPEGTPTEGARDNETPHKHGAAAGRYSRNRSSSANRSSSGGQRRSSGQQHRSSGQEQQYEQSPSSSGYGSQGSQSSSSRSQSQSSRRQRPQQQQHYQPQQSRQTQPHHQQRQSSSKQQQRPSRYSVSSRRSSRDENGNQEFFINIDGKQHRVIGRIAS